MRRSASDHPLFVLIGAAGAVATVLALLLQLNVLENPWSTADTTRSRQTNQNTGASTDEGSRGRPGSEDCDGPEIGLTPGRGPSGTAVTIEGSGFPNGEVVKFEYHTEELQPDRVREDGTFDAQVTIPGLLDPFIDGDEHQARVRAITTSPLCIATAVFALTPHSDAGS